MQSEVHPERRCAPAARSAGAGAGAPSSMRRCCRCFPRSLRFCREAGSARAPRTRSPRRRRCCSRCSPPPSQAGSWCGVVGMPQLGAEAAERHGGRPLPARADPRSRFALAGRDGDDRRGAAGGRRAPAAGGHPTARSRASPHDCAIAARCCSCRGHGRRPRHPSASPTRSGRASATATGISPGAS